MKRILMVSGMAILVFCISFLTVTALCDFLCKHTGYYEQAAQETIEVD